MKFRVTYLANFSGNILYFSNFEIKRGDIVSGDPNEKVVDSGLLELQFVITAPATNGPPHLGFVFVGKQ